MTVYSLLTTIISHLKGARTLSVWEDLTVCDFLDIIDSWKLVGWGKMGFKAQTCWTDLLAFRGVWNRSRIFNFGPDRLFFRFSRALVSIDLTDAYLHVPIHPQSRKYLRFVYEDQIFQFTASPFRMSQSPWIFTKLMDVIALHLRQCAISVFPYLDNWLIRNLIGNRLIDQTKYCLQVVQSLGFIPNLKNQN